MAFPLQIFFLAASIQITVAVVCDSGWIPAGDSCFFISDDKLKYFQATNQCASIGGRIATFYENEFNIFKEHIGGGDYWIGLVLQGDPGSEIWKWNDNTPSGVWVEDNWEPGEPDVGEYYARVTDTKKFAGLGTSFDTGYACKKGVLPSTTTSTYTSTTTATTTTMSPTTTTTTTILPTTASSTTRTVTIPTTSATSSPGEDHTSTSSTTAPTTSHRPSTTQSTSETTPHGQPLGERSDKTMPTTAGQPIESKLEDKPGKHLAIWISMGVVGICGAVAMVIGIVFCIRSRQPKTKSPEEGDPHYAELEETDKDNQQYADLSNANTLSNSKTPGNIYQEDPVLNTEKTEDGDYAYAGIGDSKVSKVAKTARANLDEPIVDECEIDTTTFDDKNADICDSKVSEVEKAVEANLDKPIVDECEIDTTSFDDEYEDLGDSKVSEDEKVAEAKLGEPKVDECEKNTTFVTPPPYDSVCANHCVT